MKTSLISVFPNATRKQRLHYISHYI